MPPRQPHKVKHSLKDIVGIVLFATLATANKWTEIEYFAQENEEFWRKYFKLSNGIPSHDTLAIVMWLIHPDIIPGLYLEWPNLFNKGEGEKLKKVLNIDGKTMRGSGNKEHKALHVISAWCDENGISLGQKVVDEIIVFPEFLQEICIKGKIITIDAMGTQVKIAEQIVNQKVTMY